MLPRISIFRIQHSLEWIKYPVLLRYVTYRMFQANFGNSWISRVIFKDEYAGITWLRKLQKWHRLKQFKVLESPDSVFQNAEKRSKYKMKILQLLTIFALEKNTQTIANEIEDITLERLLTYFKYEVCLAKVSVKWVWRAFYNFEGLYEDNFSIILRCLSYLWF